MFETKSLNKPHVFQKPLLRPRAVQDSPHGQLLVKLTLRFTNKETAMSSSSKLTKLLLIVAVFGVVSFAYSATAQADPVPIGALLSNGTRSPSGLLVLVLQNTPNEAGAIAWNGIQDVCLGDAKCGNQSHTHTFQELINARILHGANLRLVYTRSEPPG